MSVLDAQSVSINLGNQCIIDNLNWQVSAGEKWVIIGENGIGKTTILRSLIALQPIDSGNIYLNNTDITSLPLNKKAQAIGLLEQTTSIDLNTTVLEIALMAFQPYRQAYHFWHTETEINTVLSVLDTLTLKHKKEMALNQLSGGEFQRLKIALILIQKPTLMLLDEPNTYLDIRYQMQLLSLLHQPDNTNIMAIHDLNLAYQFATHALLLLGQGNYLLGEKDSILTTENLTRAFQYPIQQANGLFYYQ